MSLETRYGRPTENSVRVLAVSTSSADISISCGGYVDTITPTGFPSASPVCYHAAFDVTGLDSFTEYAYQVSQGSDVINEHLRTAPSDNDDFALMFTSCDNNTVHAGGISGFWKYMKDYAQNGELPVAGVFHVDDIGYVDGVDVDDSEADGTGLVMDGKPPDVYPVGEKNYALGHMVNMGLMTGTSDEAVAGKIYSQKQKTWGRNENRNWCQRNLALFPQWGDHEFINDIGWDFPTASAVELDPGVKDTPANIFAAGKAAYDVFYGQIQPTVFNASNSNAWGFSLGSCNLVAVDRVTNADGTLSGASYPMDASLNAVTTHLGNNQIDDILNGITSAGKSFNLLGMSMGIRYLFDDSGIYKFLSGAQHPLFNHTLAEYQRLFTASGNTPPSLMDNPRSNGTTGITVTLHGDYHRAKIEHHQNAAYTGNLAENFYSLTVGTNNGSINFGIDNNADDTSVYDGWANQSLLPAAGGDAGSVMLEYLGRNYYIDHTKFFGVPYVPYADFWGCRIEVYGSRYPKEMHVVLLGPETLEDSNMGQTTADDLIADHGQNGTHNEELWRKKFILRHGGNNAYNPDDDSVGIRSSAPASSSEI